MLTQEMPPLTSLVTITIATCHYCLPWGVGTGDEIYGNINAPRAVTYTLFLFVFVVNKTFVV